MTGNGMFVYVSFEAGIEILWDGGGCMCVFVFLFCCLLAYFFFLFACTFVC